MYCATLFWITCQPAAHHDDGDEGVEAAKHRDAIDAQVVVDVEAQPGTAVPTNCSAMARDRSRSTAGSVGGQNRGGSQRASTRVAAAQRERRMVGTGSQRRHRRWECRLARGHFHSVPSSCFCGADAG